VIEKAHVNGSTNETHKGNRVKRKTEDKYESKTHISLTAM